MACCCCGLDGKIKVSVMDGVLCCILNYVHRRGFLRDLMDHVEKEEGRDLKEWFMEHRKIDAQNQGEHNTDPYSCAYPEHNRPIPDSTIPEIEK